MQNFTRVSEVVQESYTELRPSHIYKLQRPRESTVPAYQVYNNFPTAGDFSLPRKDSSSISIPVERAASQHEKGVFSSLPS